MAGPLLSFAPDLWVGNGGQVRMYGIPFETRMTLVRLPDSGLWVHSPVAARPELIEAVTGIGPVRYLVAPNLIHSLHIADWSRRFPDARVLVSPRFPERHPEIRHDAILGETPPEDLAGVFAQTRVEGQLFLDEVVFLHCPSRTLIVTDILQRHRPQADGPFWRLIKRLAGIAAPKGGMPVDMRWSFRDRRAARRSIERILAWDFDRIVLAHGDCVLEDGHRYAQQTLGRLFV